MKPNHARRGLTLVETMMAFVVVTTLSASLFGVSKTVAKTRMEDQDAIERQQAEAITLTTFSQDVRSSDRLLTQTPTAFTLRQPVSAGGFRFVSYRLQSSLLQRGTSTEPTVAPTTWANVFDPTIYKASGGSFAYYLTNNGTGTDLSLMRRIEIAGFKLGSQRTGDLIRTPPISAVMRENANSRDLVAGCTIRVLGHWPTTCHRGGGCDTDGWGWNFGFGGGWGRGWGGGETGASAVTGGGGGGGGQCQWGYGGSCDTHTSPCCHKSCDQDRNDHEDGCGNDDDDWSHYGACHVMCNDDHDDFQDCWGSQSDDQGNVYIRLCVVNTSPSPVLINGFSASWDDNGAGDRIHSFKLGHARWGDGHSSLPSGTSVQSTHHTTTFQAGESQPLSMHFHNAPGKIDSIALQLYSSTDTARANPYIILIDVPNNS